MNQDFIELLRGNLEHSKLFQNRFDEVQNGQEPDFVTICCSDSRVLQDHMWGNEHPGHIFTCSNIGNRVFQKKSDRKVVSGDVLYPVAHTGTETILVVGHTSCGAVTATYKDVQDNLAEPEGIRHCIDLLKPYIEEGVKKLPEGLSKQEAVNHLVEYNVDRQVDFLRNSENISEDVDVVGVVYDFQNIYSGSRGELHLINVNGVYNVSELKNRYSRVQDRIERVWERN